MANIPIDVPTTSVSRFCSSGLEAVSMVASKIRSGIIDCGVGAGVESMSLSSMNDLVNPEIISD